MAVAELRRRRADGEVELVARVRAEPGGPAIVEPMGNNRPEAFEGMVADGVLDARGERLYLSDGEPFIRALPASFRGSRFWAELVDESPA